MKLSYVWCALVLAGCGTHKPQVVGKLHGVAVINSDFHSTALTLLDPNDNSVADPCLTSGTVSPRLSLALSGDVVLPSQSGHTGELALVDRTNNAIVWIDPNTCGVLRQLAVTEGFDGNPHDLLSISPTKAYLTLFSPNSKGAGGNGVVVVNPQTPALVGNIIVSTLATRDGNGIVTLARPDRAILANGVAFVTLGNIDADYASYGQGRVVLIDPNTDQIVNHIDLPDGRGCAGMATAGNVLVIGCDGDKSDPTHVTYSALFMYDISNPLAPAPTQTITASQLTRQSIYSNGLAVADGHIYFVSTGTSDAVYEDTTALFSAASPYVLGGLLVANGDVYVADAETTHPAVIRASGSTVVQRIISAPNSLLPPRTLLAY